MKTEDNAAQPRSNCILGIEYLAVLVAAVVAFVDGVVWYSPVLFGNEWVKSRGMTPGDRALTGSVALSSLSTIPPFCRAPEKATASASVRFPR